MVTAETRAGFFLLHKFHHAMLDPIYELLKNKLPCLLTSSPSKLIAYRPEIILLAEYFRPYFELPLPGSIVIHTRHGFSSKGMIKQAIESSDYFCVNSEWERDELARKGWRPRLAFWITGFTPMDKVFRYGQNPDRIMPTVFATNGPILLYAPTTTAYLNAHGAIGSDWLKPVRNAFPQLNIIVKLHPHIPKVKPEWFAAWQDATKDDAKTCLITDSDTDIYSYFPLADILITDVSSVMFYFLALERPIILVNNPRRFMNKKLFDTTGPEWKMRDMGIEVENTEELLRAIDISLTDPGYKADRRAYYRQLVFGKHTKGNAAENIATRVLALALRDMTKPWVARAWRTVERRRRAITEHGNPNATFPWE